MPSRREFLRSLMMAAGASVAPVGLDALCARAAAGATLSARGHGPLVKDPAGLLDLPQDFRYRVFSTAALGTVEDMRFSQKLSDGEPVPAMHDGMAAFPGPRGLTVLVRNHEMLPGGTPAVSPGRGPRYDALGTGGTTTLWVDGEGQLVRSFASLAGTFRNCAGGRTPWGSWLSAEECTYIPGQNDRAIHDRTPGVREPHGYLFEVDSRATGLVEPKPIKAMGRFYHEAVAVDPATGFVYMTEDRADGLLYRFRPTLVTSGRKKPRALAVGDLHHGGALEALRVVSHPATHTHHHDNAPSPFTPGRWFRVDWVPIPDVDPDVDMERDPSDPFPDPFKRRGRAAPGSTRAQGLRAGAARFSRSEGIAISGRLLFFCATDGGRSGGGQVWKLDLVSQRLALALEPNDRERLNCPDNLVVAPNRDLVVCEDGAGVNRVIGITPRGTWYVLARNAHNQSEFAGACFSPDGRTLFVNVQNPGMTFAIQGPWRNRKA